MTQENGQLNIVADILVVGNHGPAQLSIVVPSIYISSYFNGCFPLFLLLSILVSIKFAKASFLLSTFYFFIFQENFKFQSNLHKEFNLIKEQTLQFNLHWIQKIKVTVWYHKHLWNYTHIIIWRYYYFTDT